MGFMCRVQHTGEGPGANFSGVAMTLDQLPIPELRP